MKKKTLILACMVLTAGCETSLQSSQSKADLKVDLKAAPQTSTKTIQSQPLDYHHKLQKRDMASVDLIVIHSTELPSLEMAREYGQKVHYASGTGNSGHYYIDRDGAVYQYVEDERVANHVRGHNERSIGIEIINHGRYPNWYHYGAQTVSEKFTPQQIQSVIALVKTLNQKYPSITSIAGHSDLDTGTMAAEDKPLKQIRRKIDPGPLFPWDEVMAEVDLKRLIGL